MPCYEHVDASGELICGHHNEPLIEKKIPSPTQGSPMILLICPVSKQQLKVLV